MNTIKEVVIMIALILVTLAVFLLLGALTSGVLAIFVLLLKLLWPFILVGFVIKLIAELINSKRGD